jgi:hypothetical protein
MTVISCAFSQQCCKFCYLGVVRYRINPRYTIAENARVAGAPGGGVNIPLNNISNQGN